MSQFSLGVRIRGSGLLDLIEHELSEPATQPMHLHFERALGQVQPLRNLPIGIAGPTEQQVAALAIHLLSPCRADILLEARESLLNDAPGPLLLEESFRRDVMVGLELIAFLHRAMIE